MMRQYELVERVTKYDPDADEDLLNRAYVYAMKKHGNQKRASAIPISTTRSKSPHPHRDEARLGDDRRRAASRHDRGHRRHPPGDRGNVRPDIGALVDGLTKIAKLDLVTKEAAQAENLRKLLLAMSATCACCWSSWPTGCTTCARSIT
jgi:GTP diphosphokinase / guanosine-3',5'-bis(diphosphate) 3'-diphosphatase